MNIGAELNQFRITAKLGEGGMGEVYRAEDTKLRRDVAIKLVPETIGSDKERLARFEREARTLAALSHPNIAAIHQVEEADGRPFIVMELVEGDELSARIAKGLSVDESLAIAKQIAEALEAAHARGIVHRDLKPANVKIAADGTVKVLDFGLAKALDPMAMSGSDVSLAQSPTITANMTQAGVILGTASYMSPEQARGHEVDKRTDVWAFGVVLYEMLTGQQIFAGKTVTDVIAAVVTRDPDWDALPATTPQQIVRLLKSCIEKEANDRLHDIADARISVNEAIERPELVGTSVTASSRVPLIGTLIAGVVLGALLVYFSLGRQDQPQEPLDRPLSRFTIDVPDDRRIFELFLSEDGRTIAYTATGIGENSPIGQYQLFVRRLDQSEAIAIEGATHVQWATFSPDAKWIAYQHTNLQSGMMDIHKARFDGSPPQRLFADIEESTGFRGEWRRDGRLIVGADRALVAIPTDGGNAEVLATPEELYSDGRGFYGSATSVPGNDDLLIIATGEFHAGGPRARTDLYSFSTGEFRRLADGIGIGHIVENYGVGYAVEGAAMTELDLESVEAIGSTIIFAPSSYYFSASDTGAHIWYTNDVQYHQPIWVDAQGDFEDVDGFRDSLPAELQIFSVVRSPDGRHFAMVMQDREFRRALYTYDLERRELTTLRAKFDATTNVIWSPDGTTLAYDAATSAGGGGIFLRSAAGNEPPELIFESKDLRAEPADWTDDGNTMWINVHVQHNEDIYLLDIVKQTIKPFATTESDEHSPILSPDERWVAFESSETGKAEVYIAPTSQEVIDGNPMKFRVSKAGGLQPNWSSDGKLLYYITPDRRLVRTNISWNSNGEPIFGPASTLFALVPRGIVAGKFQSYVPPDDDGRFLMLRNLGEGETSPDINYVDGWIHELRERMAN